MSCCTFCEDTEKRYIKGLENKSNCCTLLFWIPHVPSIVISLCLRALSVLPQNVTSVFFLHLFFPLFHCLYLFINTPLKNRQTMC